MATHCARRDDALRLYVKRALDATGQSAVFDALIPDALRTEDRGPRARSSRTASVFEHIDAPHRILESLDTRAAMDVLLDGDPTRVAGLGRLMVTIPGQVSQYDSESPASTLAGRPPTVDLNVASFVSKHGVSLWTQPKIRLSV